MASLDTIGGLHYEMMKRCYNKKSVMWDTYGANGIHVCEEWQSRGGFVKFLYWAQEAGWEKGLTIDRIDNNKGYTPSNCRWATAKEQTKNRRNSIYVEWYNEKVYLSDLANDFGVKYGLLYARIKKGIPADEAIASLIFE